MKISKTTKDGIVFDPCVIIAQDDKFIVVRLATKDKKYHKLWFWFNKSDNSFAGIGLAGNKMMDSGKEFEQGKAMSLRLLDE